jgi:hypothetical protein
MSLHNHESFVIARTTVPVACDQIWRFLDEAAGPDRRHTITYMQLAIALNLAFTTAHTAMLSLERAGVLKRDVVRYKPTVFHVLRPYVREARS